MMQEKVKNYPHLLKIDNCYVINTDDQAYYQALARIESQKTINELHSRVSSLEYAIKALLRERGIDGRTAFGSQ